MAVIGWLNNATNALLGMLLWPVRHLAPVWALLWISALTAAFVLLVFKYTSNQIALTIAKKRLQAQLLRIVLYRHDLGAMLRAERDLFVANLAYLRHGLLPLLVVVGPMVLLFGQLDVRYGHAPLPVGEPAILSLRLRDASAADGDWRLDAPPGVVVETPALRIPSLREVDWRLRPTAPGRFVVRAQTREGAYEKVISAGDGPGRPVASRRAAGLGALLAPAESPLPTTAAVRGIEVTHPQAKVPIGSWRVHWVIVFLAATLLFAFALRGVIRVQF